MNVSGNIKMLADASFLNHLKLIYPLNTRDGKSTEQIFNTLFRKLRFIINICM